MVKQARGPSSISSREGSPLELNAWTVQHIPCIFECASAKSATYVTGKIKRFNAKMLVDSGASCSGTHWIYRTQRCEVLGIYHTDKCLLHQMESIILNGLNTPYSFIVVDTLSAPVILGFDFHLKHGMTLDFGNGTFQCNQHRQIWLTKEMP